MRTAATVLIALSLAPAATAQEAPAPRRTRVAFGPQIQPGYPGADRMVVRPFVDVSRADGDDPFAFSATDDSFDVRLVRRNGIEAGPVVGFEGARRRRDARGLRTVGVSIEPGGFVQYTFAPVRVRAELRHGVIGHEALVGVVSADYFARRRDDWLFAIGPRITFSNGKYQRAYFGVPAGSAAASGLPAFRPGGGVHAVGGNAGYLRQLSRHWGVYAFARYDRLVEDAAASPLVRRHGARGQWAGGAALSYTFGSRRN